MPYIRSKSESHYSLSKQTMHLCFWHRFGVVVITTSQLHSTQSELRFCDLKIKTEKKNTLRCNNADLKISLYICIHI